MDADQTLRLVEIREFARTGEARRRRERARLSRAEVGGAIGVSVACVEAWEAGRRRPTGEAALRYGEFLRSLLRLIGEDA